MPKSGRPFGWVRNIPNKRRRMSILGKHSIIPAKSFAPFPACHRETNLLFVAKINRFRPSPMFSCRYPMESNWFWAKNWGVRVELVRIHWHLREHRALFSSPKNIGLANRPGPKAGIIPRELRCVFQPRVAMPNRQVYRYFQRGKNRPARSQRGHTRLIAPSQLKPEVPVELDRIILKALEKDRRLRYQSAAEMQADLLRLKRSEGSHAIPAPPARGKRLSLVTGAAVLAGVLTTGALQ